MTYEDALQVIVKMDAPQAVKITAADALIETMDCSPEVMAVCRLAARGLISEYAVGRDTERPY